MAHVWRQEFVYGGETQNTEDTCKYDIIAANIVLDQEQDAEQWASTPRSDVRSESDNHELSD